MKKSLLTLTLMSLGGMFESPKIHDHNIYGYKTNPSYKDKTSMISKEERKKRTKAKRLQRNKSVNSLLQSLAHGTNSTHAVFN